MDDQKDATRASAAAQGRNGQDQRNIIVIGGSAGALDAMLEIVAAFPREFPGTIFIVSHIGGNRSHLPALLTSAGLLPATHPESGEPIHAGHIYIAPPDQHMLVNDGRIRLSRGPRQHFTRPAIDPLFGSAAEFYGPCVIGVVLSGTGGDGTAGLDAIHRAGGITVIQEPRDALYPEMPQSARRAIQIDHIAGRAELPALLRSLSSETVAMKPSAVPRQASAPMEEVERPTALTCPECGGALREVDATAVKQYRCHIGHHFAPNEVLDGQIEEVDHAPGVAVRVLNERIELCRHMAENAREGGRTMGVEHWDRLQSEAQEQLRVLQQFLAHPPSRAAEENGEGKPAEPVRQRRKA
jgi:two-component system, chemotaxis family, protein-glutamate methylesterase/glutaminase